MEIIKKTILQAVTTGTTTGSTGTCRVIIPDLNAVYFIKLSLIAENYDIGFFDAYVEPTEPVPPEPPVETFYWLNSGGEIFVDSNGDKFTQ